MTENIGVEVRRENRDGVEIRWAPHLEPDDRHTGVLMFRVGSADEPAVRRGITHLVEHLALYRLGPKQPYGFNGFVSQNRVVFHATGTWENVVEFLSSVCRSLAALPLERLEAESRVLRTEFLQHQQSVLDHLLWIRYGWRGYGLIALPEYGLEVHDPAIVQAWANERFTVENACAWFSGPVPDGIAFETLPRGQRWPCPELVPIEGLRTPACMFDQRGGVSISFVTERAKWISVSWSIALQRLHERLRFGKGITYGSQQEYFPLDAEHSHSMLFTRCLDDQAEQVRDGLLQVLREMAEQGPTAAELAEGRQNYDRDVQEPDQILSHLDYCAYNRILGTAELTQADLRRDLYAMTPESCAASVGKTMDSAILMLPTVCTAPPLFHSYPIWSQATVSGRKYRTPKQRFPWSKKGPELIVGQEGISLVVREGQAITVRYSDCAGAIVDRAGILRLISGDGHSVWLRAADWHGGEQAYDTVMSAVPRDRQVRIQAH